ncbi:Rcs stress response system protein RcsF [Providencia stuartii]|uniref:Outer membrane lipoprotein RcsF n=2 Tax=Providencia TaxID=586 RepID=A0A1S1HRF6_PROST|nr:MULTISPECIES: Rcs stress response system protein RcsF [Providencia]MDV5226408.1 Rcs stress response system protein RcsF [Providencia rettgeri]ELR5038085.1 Rcs stress response system protein RcsF [Providencia stuartii]ELR5080998.1 Rcs stress response system protein RcsF [Providencia stuartii]ELR5113233.1 Rcs stress response system protein RcsF [Providencia stuartii]ELR5300873.1 Rcs stress response system protein RcsF [Providencia stuartii]
MRLLLLTLATFILAGCGMNQYIHQGQNKGFTSMKLSKPVPKKVAEPNTANVKLMNSPEELLGMPFKDLGVVSGESCRESIKSPPANLNTAKKSMLTQAAYIAADAVLLHQCQTLASPGCYQATICEGSAIQIVE